MSGAGTKESPATGAERTDVTATLVAEVVTTTTVATTPTTVATTQTTAPTTTTPPTTVAAMTFPITYTGTGTLTFSESNSTGACVWDWVLSVTLLPDGAVEGTITGPPVSVTWEGDALICVGGDQQASDLIGNHEAGAIELRRASNRDEVWLRGDYDHERLEIDQQFEYVTGKTTYYDWEFLLGPAAG